VAIELAWQLFLSGIVVGCVYALVALGFSVIYNTVRFFHFAHGAVYAWAAYLAVAGVSQLKLPLGVAALGAIVVSACLGALTELLIYRPLKKRGATSLVLLLASLGVFIVLQNCISLAFGDATRSLGSPAGSRVISVWGATLTYAHFGIVLVSLALFLLTGAFVRYSGLGVKIRAIAENPDLAQIWGIDSQRITVYVYALGSALAAVAAIMVSLDNDVTPVMGAQAMFMGVVAIVLGGLGNLSGAVWAGLLLGVTQNMSVLFIDSRWREAIAYGVFFLVVIARPTGLWGRRSRGT
jgi:branched-chain amino acid transport system permease protein